MKKIEVMYQGGESRYSNAGCDYMLARYIITESGEIEGVDIFSSLWDDEDTEELYVEVNPDDYGFDIDDLSTEDCTFEVLKELIEEQARERGIDTDLLQF